jgi:hypothetical protein
MLTEEQLREFTERGFVVIRDAVPDHVVRSATKAVDELIDAAPPGEDVRGNHFYFVAAEDEPALLAPLTAGPALTYAEALTGPATLATPRQIQVALNIPPFDHRPGRPHIDGDSLNFPRSRPPGTFTLLAGVLMSDQSAENCGNLWVWPGTHLTHAEYFRTHGPDAFTAYPDIDLPEPEQITGRTGDLLLMHYLLGHNIGGNYATDRVRRALYYRVERVGHSSGERWREFLQDPWLDYDVIRSRPAAPPPGPGAA